MKARLRPKFQIRNTDKGACFYHLLLDLPPSLASWVCPTASHLLRSLHKKPDAFHRQERSLLMILLCLKNQFGFEKREIVTGNEMGVEKQSWNLRPGE